MKINTQFYIDGKWVELDELIEKAAKWDEVYDFLKISQANIVVEVLKRGLKDSKSMDAIKEYAHLLTKSENGIYHGNQLRAIGTTLKLKAMGYHDV